MLIENGIVNTARYLPSPHFNQRPADASVSLLVIHNISLPPNQFGGPYIDHLFTGQLDPDAHPFFHEIYKLRVSAHLLIRRDGELVQYVPFDERAWHAGVSSFQGVQGCNDYSIGIELEGADDVAYTPDQYRVLVAVTRQIMQQYPQLSLGRIIGHRDIAPGRKSDPGVAFDWALYRQLLCKREGP